jgi:hypothetical protein
MKIQVGIELCIASSTRVWVYNFKQSHRKIKVDLQLFKGYSKLVKTCVIHTQAHTLW